MPLDDGGRRYIFIVLGVVFGAGLAFSLNWVGKRSQAKKAPASAEASAGKAAAQPGPDTSLLFKKEEDALRELGEPDARYQRDDRLSLLYSRPMPSQPEGGCPDVQIMDGVIKFIIKYPCDSMPDRIATAQLNHGVEPKPVEQRDKTMAFEQAFEMAKQGSSQGQVLSGLGEPDDRRIQDGKEIWQYDTLIVEKGAPHKLAVLFDEAGRVLETHGM